MPQRDANGRFIAGSGSGSAQPRPDFAGMAQDMLRQLPAEVAKLAMEHFKGSFEKEGFTDYAFIAWPRRLSDPMAGTTHKLLNKSGKLKDSLRVASETIQKVEIEAGQGLPYAGIQNNGGTVLVAVTPKLRKYAWAMFYKMGKTSAAAGKWRAMALTKKSFFRIRIPQRRYIGPSEALNANIDRLAIQSIQRAFGGA